MGDALGPSSNINPTTPHRLDIYVLSNNYASHPFRPLVDILPRDVVINGATYRHVKIRRDPADENGDHIPDAIITIKPRSAMGLTAETTSITVSGLTRPTPPFAHESWSGVAPITVGNGALGGAGGGGGGAIEQPYQAYVAITLPTSYGGQFLNFSMTGVPAGKKFDFRIVRGQTLYFQTASGVDPHKFVLEIPRGSSFTIGPTGTLHYGLSPSGRPNYNLVYTGRGNIFNLEPA